MLKQPKRKFKAKAKQEKTPKKNVKLKWKRFQKLRQKTVNYKLKF